MTTEQLTLECQPCAGLGYLPCPCDTNLSCTCPLWECPECLGRGDLLLDGAGPHRHPRPASAVDTPNPASTAQVPSDRAAGSPEGATSPSQGRRSNTGRGEPGGVGRTHADPSATTSTESSAATAGTATALTPSDTEGA